MPDLRGDEPVRFADGPDPEIVGPTPKLGVDPPNLFGDLQPSRSARRQFMDLAAEPRDLLPGRAGTQVRFARPAVIVPSLTPFPPQPALRDCLHANAIAKPMSDREKAFIRGLPNGATASLTASDDPKFSTWYRIELHGSFCQS
jgi:hypothetical protein